MYLNVQLLNAKEIVVRGRCSEMQRPSMHIVAIV
jgi:hypothetical protein